VLNELSTTTWRRMGNWNNNNNNNNNNTLKDTSWGTNNQYGWKLELIATSFALASCLPSSPTLKMEATCSSNVSVDFQRTTRRYISKERTFHNHRWEPLILRYLTVWRYEGINLWTKSDLFLLWPQTSAQRPEHYKRIRMEEDEITKQNKNKMKTENRKRKRFTKQKL
jgi:hypothetical protein